MEKALIAAFYLFCISIAEDFKCKLKNLFRVGLPTENPPQSHSTIAFPILALYALSNEEPREPKRIYKNLGKYYETLQQSAIKIPDKFAEILKKSDINID